MHALLISLSVAVLLLTSSAQAAALGPGNPPPGANNFRIMHRRAEWVRDSVLKLAPKANGRCVYAVALELVGLMELAWSEDHNARGNRPRTVRKGEADAFRARLRENAVEECQGSGGPPGGLYETVKGLLSFASEQEDWMADNYGRLKANVIKAAQGLGLLVPAAEGGAQLALPTVAVPILNPELFMPRREPESL